MKETDAIRKLAMAVGKYGNQEKVNSHAITVAEKRVKSEVKHLVSAIKKSIGGRRDRRVLHAWIKEHPEEASKLPLSKADRPQLFHRSLYDLIRKQTLKVQQPVEQDVEKGRKPIVDVKELEVDPSMYVREAKEFKNHVISTSSNMRDLLNLYLNIVGAPAKSKGESGLETAVRDLSGARDFQRLYVDVQNKYDAAIKYLNAKPKERKEITDWSSVRYATANSIITMLAYDGAAELRRLHISAGASDEEHRKGVKAANLWLKEQLNLPILHSVIVDHRRALGWLKKNPAQAVRAASPAPAKRAVSPSPKRPASRAGSR
jgi:hypothetical protein